MNLSKLDPGQVLKMAADEVNEALKVNMVQGDVQFSIDSEITDDSPFTPGTSQVIMFGASFDDTSPDSIDEGDGGSVRMSANRNMYTTIRDASGNERGVNVTATNALKTDGSAVTQPVSAVSLPLPTGAATAVKQPALGTAGTASVDVISVQGIASMTPIAVSPTPSALTIKQAAITVGTTAVRLTTDAAAPSATRVLLCAVADPTSTASFYVGSSGVTNSGATRGLLLVPGQSFAVTNDAADYYIVSSTAGQSVFIVEQE